MHIEVRPTEYGDVEAMRELYRQEADCQIRYDSLLSRRLADPYLVLVGGRVGGYGAVANRYDKGRLTEFYTTPHVRSLALPMFRALLAASRATYIAAQTNIPLMLLMLYDCARNITAESLLFYDASVTRLACPDGLFRRAAPADAASTFSHQHEPVGDWVVEADGAVVATGGFACHYNPPYADIFMEVAESARGRGFGSYLVQEVKRVCYEEGKKPAARCDPENLASRRTLEKAGFLPCGCLLVGEVGP